MGSFFELKTIHASFHPLPSFIRRAWQALPFLTKLLLAVTGLAVLVLLVSLAQNEVGLPAPRLVSNSDGEPVMIGARGPVKLQFAEPMLRGSVERRISFDPPVAGDFVWDDTLDQSLSFWPTRPLSPGLRFTIRLAAGARSKNERELRRTQTWQVEIQQPELLFLSPSHAPELWIVSNNGQKRIQLTHTGGGIVDYGVSFDGNHIAYAVKNEQQGSDLWEMDRTGGSAVLLLACGADWCANPSYAPNGNTMVYSRRRMSGLPDRPPEMPRIWTLDQAAQTTAELFADPRISGAQTYWSPDGRTLAFYDDGSAGVRLYHVETHTNSLFPAAEGTGIEWSPDGASLLTLEAGLNGETPYSSVI